MTRRGQTWLIVGVGIFTAINLGGAIWAVAMGEPLHAGAHVALTFVGTFAFWRLVTNRFADRWPWKQSDMADAADGPPDGIDSLQQALDAVAVEVERIGEGQRFMARLVAEQDAAKAGAKGAPASAGNKTPASPPNVRRD